MVLMGVPSTTVQQVLIEQKLYWVSLKQYSVPTSQLSQSSTYERGVVIFPELCVKTLNVDYKNLSKSTQSISSGIGIQTHVSRH